ncbi:hypothetical protein EDD85DRAFT_954589 [Armillaria nabsnona]|nr:hypothetical protein EDD85DRAFT_954589 [Armillaria nabsnona]
MSHTTSELDLLRIEAGELLEEVDDLKDKLKKAKEQAEVGQNEAEWWQVKHYQEQYHMCQQVRDLEDEIIALKEENIQAGAPNQVLHAWDRLCGAVLTKLKDLLITSPNASVIYTLPLGVNWEMAMYQNYCYADDDPCCWPQPYMSTRPYLTCITTQAAPSSDTYQPLYGLPSCVQFEELGGSSLIHRPGLWDKQEMAKLKTCCQLLLDVARGVELPVTLFLSERRRLLPMFLERLEALPLTFKHLHLCVVETQRLALELRAYLDYYLLYRPCMDSPNAVSLSAPKFDLAGMFTTSTTVVQELFKAGILMWLLRSLSVLPTTRINRAVKVTPCTEGVDLQACPLHLREVYVSAATDKKKYQAFERFTQSHFTALNPFLWMPGVHQQHPVLPTPPQETAH